MSSTNGKICYMELPSEDVERDSRFYSTVFGWRIRERGDGHKAFDDVTGAVSGSWIRRRRPWSGEPGLLVYIMVDSVVDSLEMVVANGGLVTQAVGQDPPEITARFRDPSGNVLGLYQEPAQARGPG